MKKNFLLSVIVLLALVVMSDCKKKKEPAECSTEPALQVTTSPAVNSTEPPAPGPDFPLRVSVTSSLPASGVTITVKARPENSQTTFYSETKNSTTAGTDFTIKNTPSATPSIVEIAVSSTLCPSNKFSGSYRYSRK